MKWKILALMLGFTALYGAIGERSDNFILGGLERGEPVVEMNFTGLQWACGRDICWAGRVNDLSGESTLTTGRSKR